MHLFNQSTQHENFSFRSFQIDAESTLWVLSNRLPRFIFGQYDSREFNFHILSENTNTALVDSPCMIMKVGARPVFFWNSL